MLTEKYYSLQAEEVIKKLDVSVATGLSADEVVNRQEKYGMNQLESKKKKSFFVMFFEEFKSTMIVILLIAAIISGVTGILSGEGLLETWVILAILVVNALIGAVQEKRAEASLDALRNMSSPRAKVIRNGGVTEVNSQELVPGDVVILETGDIVPADIRLTQAVNLKIQEASMTGESVPVEKQTEALYDKDISIGDRTNMAFTTGMVTYGRGEGIVVGTGMNTEVGKIAQMLQHTDSTETPMSIRLEQLGKILGYAAIAICVVIFGVGLLYGQELLEVFMTAVSLAVAAIPEGLPAISTVVLSIGVQRMVKKNAIIRTLPSVETLGCATVICSDKTGTLTQNKMTVLRSYADNHTNTYEQSENREISTTEEKLLQTAVLCSDAHLNIEDGKSKTTGDPTETALLDVGLRFNINKNEVEEKFPRVAEIPFDSERKRMTTVNKFSENQFVVNVKGGLDEILSVTTHIFEQGNIRKILKTDIEKVNRVNEVMAGDALRVLAMAYKELDKAPEENTVEVLENKLVFLGLVGMIDPARPEVIDAVAKCSTAGIRTVMITGDHKITATAIAKEIGIMDEDDVALTGSELESMSDGELFNRVKDISVYARVAPEHKVRIVKAWQKHNDVVAMTGDGVNDAPALKQADIGAAMGIVGTEVAKDAADMVLTDDNFATIVSAVEEGRRIYANILKAVQFLLSCNVGEIVLLLITSLANLGAPLIPIHILWVNLVTDSMPALALSVDPAEKDVMQRKPRNPKQGFMTKGVIWRTLYQGITIGLLSLVAFLLGKNEGSLALGQTMAFSVLAFSQLFHVNNLHSYRKSAFAFNPFHNKPLILAILGSILMMALTLFVPPIRDTFGLVTMDSTHWWIVIGLSVAPIAIVEIFKLLKINTMKDDE
ncbi:MAG: calcium-translocating P-type ATPase, PMCA-type [Paludibacteraceae bacterium]